MMHRLSALSLLFLMAASVSEGALIPADDPNFGVGSLTQDPSQGLEWLDVSLTSDLSFDDVLADAGGFLSAGFRHANEAEIHAVMSEFAFTEIWIGVVMTHRAENAAPANEFNALFGNTFNFTDGSPGISALYLESSEIRLARVNGGAVGAAGLDQDFTFSSSTRLSGVGHFLVREAVFAAPEPSSLVVVASGLLAMFGCARRRFR